MYWQCEKFKGIWEYKVFCSINTWQRDVTRISTVKASLSTSPLGLLRTPNLGQIMQISERNKEEIEEERRLMGFLLRMESITHWKRKAHPDKDSEWTTNWQGCSGWSGGWAYRAWNSKKCWDLRCGARALQASVGGIHGKGGSLKRFVVVYGFFSFLFPWDDSKD